MTNRQIWPEDIQPVEELCFEHLDKRYVRVITIRLVLVYVILMSLALLIPVFVTDCDIVLLVSSEAVMAVAAALNVAMARKIYNFKGYAFREKDISYRSGIFFEKTTTIPFSKIQQVSVRVNPVSRMFGLYYVDVTNGSQRVFNSVTIPGLSQEKAERLKQLLMNNVDCDHE